MPAVSLLSVISRPAKLPPRPLLSPDAAVRAAEMAAPQLAAMASLTDREGDFPVEAFDHLRALGLLTAALPAALGGTDLGTRPGTLAYLLHTLRHIGRGNLAVGRVYEGHVNALLLLLRYATPAQRRRWAEAARGGDLFAVWNTEAADGLRLEPAPNGRDWRLHGAKTFCSGAGQVRRPLVTAMLPDGRGRQMLIVDGDRVPAGAIDRSFWKPLGMRATASFKVDFTGTPVRAADLLGPPDAYYQQPDFTTGAVRFAAVQVGGAEAVLTAVRDHLCALHRLDDVQQQERIGQLAALVETGRLWLDGAAALLENPAADQWRQMAYSNLTRTVVENVCLDALRLAERAVGARGLLRPSPLERLHRDLTTYLRQPAPDAAIASAGHHVLANERAAHALWE